MDQLYFKIISDWREWLAMNYENTNAIWLVFYKKLTGQPTLEYGAAVEEALCFGWIDGIIKSIDEQRYMRRFTRRRPGSKWSALNKQRANRLIQSGRMAKPGLAMIIAAKKDGSWDRSDRPDLDLNMPDDFRTALDKIPDAAAFFQDLPPSQRKNYIGWIVSAKRETTRAARIDESVRLLANREKLGLK